MNKQFDIIIIGDSPEGYKVLKQLAGASRKLKVAYVSREFKTKTTRDFLNVEYIKATVLHLNYRTRLFGCFLSNDDVLFSTHLIIASGQAYAPYKVHGKSVPCVFNTVYDIPKSAKTQPAVVIGDSTQAAKLAISVAKKYKQVYFCLPAFEPDVSKTLLAKLTATKNLLLLPNAVITKVTAPDGKLQGVDLSNYASLTCNAIFIQTAVTPETSFIPDNLVAKDKNGYCIVSECAESTLTPKCFVLGSAATKSTAKQKNMAVATILADFLEV
jgi:thioredoxin reductase